MAADAPAAAVGPGRPVAPVPRVAVLSSHPTPYTAAFFRVLAATPGLDITVLYTSAFGTASDPRPMRNFGRRVVWDTDPLAGYQSKLLWSPFPAHPQKRWTVWGPAVTAELLHGNYDVAVLYGWAYPVNWLAAVTSRFAGLPFLLYGDSNVRDRPARLVAPVRAMVLKGLFRRSAGALYTGTFNRDFYIRFGMAPEKLWFSPYAVDATRFGGGSRQVGRRALGLRPHTTYFLFVGTLIRRKRPLDLLRAARRLQERGRAVGIVFAGTGEQEAPLRGYAAEHGLAEIRFMGFVNQDELPQVYAATDVLVLPSERDPRATVVNEAMAAGRPVVVSTGTGVWGPGDLVTDGREGRVFAAGDVNALTEACEALLDPATRARMGTAAHERSDYWSFGRAAEGWRKATTAVAR